MTQDRSYFAHETAAIDQPCQVGVGTKIWHFTDIMRDWVIGERCNIGKNVRCLNRNELHDRVRRVHVRSMRPQLPTQGERGQPCYLRWRFVA
jgi:hypothetical protein